MIVSHKKYLHSLVISTDFSFFYIMILPARNRIYISSPSYITKHSIFVKRIIGKNEKWSNHYYNTVNSRNNVNMPIWCIILSEKIKSHQYTNKKESRIDRSNYAFKELECLGKQNWWKDPRDLVDDGKHDSWS